MRGEPLPLGVRSLLPQDHRGHEKELWRMGEGTGGKVHVKAWQVVATFLRVLFCTETLSVSIGGTRGR